MAARKTPVAASIAGLVVLAGLITLFQNCGEAFGVKSQAELQSLSCGESARCDSQGFPLGKVVIDFLPSAEYPTGTYDPDRVESRVATPSTGTPLSLVRLANLPAGFACSQTWLRGSVAAINSTPTIELLTGLENMDCRVGSGISQSEAFLDYLLSAGCFFVETNYTVVHDVSTGQINLAVNGTAVNDPTFSRATVPAVRIQFRCELSP